MGAVDFQNQHRNFFYRQSHNFQLQPTRKPEASLSQFLFRHYLTKARVNRFDALFLFSVPGIEGRYFQFMIFTENGDTLSATGLIGEKLPNGFGGMAHRAGIVWGKALARFSGRQDVLSRTVTFIVCRAVFTCFSLFKGGAEILLLVNLSTNSSKSSERQ